MAYFAAVCCFSNQLSAFQLFRLLNNFVAICSAFLSGLFLLVVIEVELFSKVTLRLFYFYSPYSPHLYLSGNKLALIRPYETLLQLPYAELFTCQTFVFFNSRIFLINHLTISDIDTNMTIP